MRHSQKYPESYIVGNRFLSRPRSIQSVRDLLLVVFNRMLLISGSSRIGDVTSCIRMFPVAAFANFRFRNRYFVEQDMHVHAHKTRMDIIEVPVNVTSPADRRYSHFSIFGMVQVIVAWLPLNELSRLTRFFPVGIVSTRWCLMRGLPKLRPRLRKPAADPHWRDFRG
jgi:hypothetical protein